MRTLWDRQQINDALLRYCRGIDRCDEELILSAYHPDARDDHGVFVGTAAEFSAWAVAGLLRVVQSTTHELSNVMIEVNGDTARAESLFVGSHVQDTDEGITVNQFHGRYLDVLTFRNDRWAIEERRTVYDWTESRSTQRTHPADDPRFAHGSRSRTDPVYVGWERWSGASNGVGR
ncbi:nuclear transport factor 2 family protein [Aeromicrobium panaciterrae]|uniref:nuclear transport factor 2 family protein n=1 Tax=Aeromicrobium panaciterrae TaxID=363861 RepID=UPI0031E2E75D